MALSSDPDSGFFGFYWLRIAGSERILIGDGGLLRESPRRVMIGYAVLPEWQGLGLGTEAIAALVSFAFDAPAVEEVVAYTHLERLASIRVLEKNGFARTNGEGEPGTIRYARRR